MLRHGSPLPAACRLSSLLFAAGLFVFPFLPVTAADAEDRPPPATQVFRAPDLWGGTDVAFEGCKANSGEYTFWVYAQGSRCGAPREEANRVVMFRQPLRATSCLPGGHYFAWAYGSGEPGHPWINLCATTCVKGALPPTPGWILLGEIDLCDRHQLLLKSWEQPDGHIPPSRPSCSEPPPAGRTGNPDADPIPGRRYS